MKKLFTNLFVLMAISHFALAQKTSAVEFGINIGSNQSFINQEQSYNGKSSGALYGLNIGFSAEYYFSDKWGIKGKLIYDQKGWGDGSILVGDNSGIEFGNFRLNYLTIPVMANWHFAPKRNWYLNFGPYAGFLLKAKIAGTDFNVSNDPFSSTDFGGALGLGIKIPLSNNVKLFFEVEGEHGFTNINSDNPSQNIQNTRSSLNIGLNF
jgi:opacity protein-like surface antigen